MKGKHLVILLVALLCAMAVTFVMFYQREDVQASSTALASSGWKAFFTTELKSNSISKGNIYVVNEEGQKVSAVIEIADDGQSVIVRDVKPGKYKLHVNQSAFKKGSLLSSNHQVAFQVIESLEPSSEKELKAYFSAVLNRENMTRNVYVEESAENSTESSESKSEDSSYSTTNNQVEGIEEGDYTVVNEQYIFTQQEQSVIIVDARNSQNLKQVAKLTPVKDGYVEKIMLHNNLLLVVVNEYINNNQQLSPSGTSMTKLFIYDVKNPAEAKVVRIVGQEGHFSHIRKVDHTVYIIVNYMPNYWMLEEDEHIELRPAMYDSVVGENYERIDYKDLSILPGTLEGQYSIIKAIDLNSTSESAVTTKGFLGSSDGLFMSENALYLTGFKYEVQQTESTHSKLIDRIWFPQAVNTDVYKWNIAGDKIDFVGTATIKGTVLNQFSMDEYNGYFRIATTEGVRSDNQTLSKNHLFILNSEMKIVGQINDLAPGERIYSARFMGDKTYLVTFKETDPLFVIDVAEPTNPKVLGELKIPGFSNYLHPLDENHLIGIGYDTAFVKYEYAKEPQLVTTSMKLSLFDVSDFRNPKETQHVLIGGKGSYSDVQHDAKALFRHEERGLYGFPVVLYDEKVEEYVYQGSGALVYKITVEGIQLKGNLIIPATEKEQYEDWESKVQRIVYIGNTLYTIAYREVKSYDLNTFKLIDTLKIN